MPHLKYCGRERYPFIIGIGIDVLHALVHLSSFIVVIVTKQRDQDTHQHSLFYQIDYPEIVEGVVPRHRFMSAYEQRMEPPDRQWQYLLFAAEPYETIGFKVT